MRKFDTGATRDDDASKLDYEGYLSPVVLRRYAEYMHSHQTQSDSNVRDSDNWQKGIPKDVYMQSMARHFMSVWESHRYKAPAQGELCALLFNVMGYLFEDLKDEAYPLIEVSSNCNRVIRRQKCVEFYKLRLPYLGQLGIESVLDFDNGLVRLRTEAGRETTIPIELMAESLESTAKWLAGI